MHRKRNTAAGEVQCRTVTNYKVCKDRDYSEYIYRINGIFFIHTTIYLHKFALYTQFMQTAALCRNRLRQRGRRLVFAVYVNDRRFFTAGNEERAVLSHAVGTTEI